MNRTWLRVLGIGFLIAGTVLGGDEEAGRGVARISVINGDVSVRRGDSGDFVAAAVNGPLVVADRVLTGAASRAEIQFDWANMLRVGAQSEVRLSELENRRYQVQVARGTVTLRVLRASEAQMELNTPSISIRPAKKGSYRVTVGEDGNSEVTVRSGEAEVFSPKGVERLRSGRTMLARGSASDPEFQMVQAADRDDWDRWNDQRDRDLERSRSYQYVSRDIYGADDLDSYGNWVWVPPYGWVWTPNRIYADWAPYRYGRWTWADYYGWTWLSYEPWGWAPYHYGRWFHSSYGWAWYPGGGIHSRHYWSPALVAFFGWGHSGVSVGVGFGSIGWVPLAPYEPYYPWYGRGHYGGYRNTTYVDNSVNIVNNVNITNIYRNARVTNGLSGADSADFVGGRAARAINASDVSVRQASLVRGPVPVTPGAPSLRMSDREARAGNLPRTADNQRFYSTRPPAAVERVPFEDQRRGMDRIVRRTFSEGSGSQTAGSVRATGPASAGARGDSGNLPRTAEREVPAGTRVEQLPRTESGNLSRTVPAQSGSEGWRRVGEPTTRTETAPAGNIPRNVEQPRPGGSTAPAQSGSGGWRRFGEPVNRTETAPAGNVPRNVEQPRSGGSAAPAQSSSDGWRRFGSPDTGARRETSPQPVERRADPAAGRRDSGDNWRRFGGGGSSGDNGGSVRQERMTPAPRNESPRQETSPRMERRTEPDRSSSAPRMERSEPIHINPPIVRERATPRYEAPRYEAPRQSAPRYEAPRQAAPSAAPPRSEGSRGDGGGMSRGESRGGTRRER